jgi:thiamine biosynthesis lipoprotein ApbE
MLMSAAIGVSNVLNDALSTAFFVLGADGCRDFLTRNPGLTALYFLSTGGRTVKQIVLESADTTLPEGSFLRLEDE